MSLPKKCKKCECPAGEKWAVPFADFLSLLLALFIALYALASVNLEKQAALKEEFMKIYGMNTESETLKEQQEDTQVATADQAAEMEEKGKAAEAAKLAEQLKNMENESILEGNLNQTTEGTFFTMPANLLFDKGSADLNTQNGLMFVQKIARVIHMMPVDTEIAIKGYADNGELAGQKSKYQDALELSTARANSVLRELVKNKIPTYRLYTVGYGNSRSKDVQGTTSSNYNRRVEFEVKTMQTHQEVVEEQTIFDKAAEQPNNTATKPASK